MSSSPTVQTSVLNDIVVKRIIDAPIEQVWQAWTDPQAVMRWWGPQGYTSPECKIDLREGSQYIFCMRAPPEQGGQDSYVAGVYRQIVPLERLEFTQYLAGPDGSALDPVQIGFPPDFPKQIRTLVTLKPRRDMTEMTVTEFDWTLSQMYVYSVAGLHQTIDKLVESL